MKEQKTFQGSAISEGIARGTVFLRSDNFQEPLPQKVSGEDVSIEIDRFEQAIQKTKEELDQLAQKANQQIGAESSGIFEAHSMILEDRIVLDQLVESIQEQKVSAAFLFHQMMHKNMETLRAMGDQYFSERAIDFEDISRRVVTNILGGKSDDSFGVDMEHIVVSPELTPSDTAAMNHELLLGFVTERGSATSHVAIIARSLALPAVVGVPSIASVAHSGDEMLIDGYSGKVFINPDTETLEKYQKLEVQKQELTERIVDDEGEAQTKDGHSIVLSANIEFTREIALARENKAQGIGLYRTEFLFLGEEFPDEEQQYQSYRKAVEVMNPDLVIYRTLDIGGDKIGESTALDQDNPFLGWRGIRLSLDLEDVFRTQLRAILRAGSESNIGIMYPMISGLNEVRQANEILAECQKELKEKGIAGPKELLIGAMIEVPSAAIVADKLAAEVDFFSIGTNDLVQYTVAVDRVNTYVEKLYQPTHPAVLSLIRDVVEDGHENGIWVGVCGEMAADIDVLPLLIGAGIDELSVAAPMIPKVKFALRRIDRAETRSWLAGLFRECSLPEEFYEASQKRAQKDYPELYS